MNDFVQMESHICPVCGCKHQHNTGVLIDKRLKSIPEEKTVTGYGLCEEHDSLNERGFIALIGINPPADASITTVKFHDADRTGHIVHMHRSAFPSMFGSNPPDRPFVFVEQKVIDMLKDHMNFPEAVKHETTDQGPLPN